MTKRYSHTFKTEPEATAFAEGLKRASHGDVHSIEVLYPTNILALPFPFVTWVDETEGEA